jgi:hypothetical protein
MSNKKVKDSPKVVLDKSDKSLSTKNLDATLRSFPKPQSSATDEEVSHLQYKETVNLYNQLISQELENLAQQIGIDYENEKKKYHWFLVQVRSFEKGLKLGGKS